MGITNIVCFYYFYWETENFFERDRASIFTCKENSLLTNFTYTAGRPVLLKITGYNYLNMEHTVGKLWE